MTGKSGYVRGGRQLMRENAALRARLAEAEHVLAAIQRGDVDALVVEGPDGPKVYTLQSVEHIYRILVETMNEGAVTLHPSGTVLYGNRHLVTLLGEPLEQIIGTSFTRFVVPELTEPLRQLLVAGAERPSAGRSALRRADGRVIPVRLALHPLTEASSTAVCAIITDMSDHEQSQAELRAALEEKEVLLREIHHRVKNNLQVITSLLRLQSRALDDERVSSAFQDSLNRIRAMALVHEQLYGGTDLAQVDAGAYLRALTASVMRGSTAGGARLRCDVDGSLSLAMDLAVPLGLIVSELVTNSLKHGFPHARGGQIDVRLTRKDDHLRLTVSDDGVGLPPGLESASSLGLRIVRTLARQLGGTLRFRSERGATTEMTVPASPGAEDAAEGADASGG